MSRKNSIVILPVVLGILALFSCFGCGTITGAQDVTTTPTTTPTQIILSEQQATQILVDSMTNYKNISTYKYEMSMSMLVNAIADGETGTVTMLIIASGAMNTLQNLAQMKLEMAMNANIPGEQTPSQNITSEIYLLSDYIYMKLDMPQGEQWVKVPVSDALKAQFNLDTVDQQMGIVKDPTKTECLRVENVGGVDCYVMSVTPNATEMDAWLKNMNSSFSDLGVSEVTKSADVVKDFTYLCYIAVDSNRLMKMSWVATLEYSAAQLGSSSSTDNMKISVNMNMRIYDHNVPVVITLPDAAQSATELSEDIFSNN